MNIKSTYRPVPNPINIERAKADAKTEQPAQEPKDNVQFTIHVPKNIKKRAIATGIGGVATTAAAFLLGGGIGGMVAAAAIGGASGAALSSDTAANLYTDFKSKRAEKKAAARLEAESASQAEQLFQAKVQTTAEERLEAKWAKSGEGLVADKVESELLARVEAESKPSIEAQLSERLAKAVETGVAESLKSKSEEIEQRVDQQVESKIAAHIEEKASDRVKAEVEQRLDKAVTERIETEMKERAGEIDTKVEARVEQEIAEKVQAETEAQLAQRNKVASYIGDMKLHKKLAYAAGKHSYTSGVEPWREGFEIISKTATGMSDADRSLMEMTLEPAEDGWITPAIKKFAGQSEFKFFEQAAQILGKSTASKSAATDPEAYLEAVKLNNHTWDSNRRLMKTGLKLMIKHNDLSPSEKMLAEKAMVNESMNYKAEHAHLKQVMKLLAGQEI